MRHALHYYGFLCVLAGIAGLVLSLWISPQKNAQQLRRAAHQLEAQAATLDSPAKEGLATVARNLKDQAAEMHP